MVAAEGGDCFEWGNLRTFLFLVAANLLTTRWGS